jgi:membrane fusion protein, multidrug efflux system
MHKARLQKLRWPLMLVAGIAIIGGGVYFHFTGGRFQSTDDAYAEAATVSINANEARCVSEIEVRDNEFVHQDATLFGSWRELPNEEAAWIGRP